MTFFTQEIVHMNFLFQGFGLAGNPIVAASAGRRRRRRVLLAPTINFRNDTGISGGRVGGVGWGGWGGLCVINFYLLALCTGHCAVAKNAKAGQCGATSRAAAQKDTNIKKKPIHIIWQDSESVVGRRQRQGNWTKKATQVTQESQRTCGPDGQREGGKRRKTAEPPASCLLVGLHE